MMISKKLENLLNFFAYYDLSQEYGCFTMNTESNIMVLHKYLVPGKAVSILIKEEMTNKPIPRFQTIYERRLNGELKYTGANLSFSEKTIEIPNILLENFEVKEHIFPLINFFGLKYYSTRNTFKKLDIYTLGVDENIKLDDRITIIQRRAYNELKELELMRD
jgi:hypothetical protein